MLKHITISTLWLIKVYCLTFFHKAYYTIICSRLILFLYLKYIYIDLKLKLNLIVFKFKMLV